MSIHLDAMKRIETAMNNTAELYGVIAYYDGGDNENVKYHFDYTSHFHTAKAQEKAQEAIRAFVHKHGGKNVSTISFALHAEFPTKERKIRMKTTAEVLAGLHVCANNQPCKDCPYETPGFSRYPACIKELMDDATAIIKGQGGGR